MVLNSLSGRATQESLKLLASFGNFVEIGKRDIMEGKVAPMKEFLNNGSYHVFDFDRALKSKNHYIMETEQLQARADAKGEAYSKALQKRIDKSNWYITAVERLAKEFIDKGWRLPTTPFEARDIVKAFEMMMKGDHIGKMCVRFPPACPHPQVKLPSSLAPKVDTELVVYKSSTSAPELFFEDETYIIVGGTSGLGLEIGYTMALQMEHACNICLISRSGGKGSAELERKLKLLKRYVPHKNVRAFAVDVTDGNALEQFLEDIRTGRMQPFAPKIGGVFHLAMVLQDTLVRKMSGDDMVKVRNSHETMPDGTILTVRFEHRQVLR